MAAVVLGAAVPAAADTLTGVLVDHACYAMIGAKAAGSDHAKCAMTCAQKGHRLALVTPTGVVYMVIGVYTQNNNAKLIRLMNQQVVLIGTVGARVLDSAVAVVAAKSDGRRPTGSQDGVLAAKQVRKGDFREGDVAEVAETTIEAIDVQLAFPPPPIK
jgi:hypothetical protein